jgi:excisionase family DNA binding protein
MRNIKMRTYSISEAARELGVQRNTLYSWIREKLIPTPSTQVISGIRCRFWTEREMTKLREYKAARYWGKGIDRRTGKKAKQKKA